MKSCSYFNKNPISSNDAIDHNLIVDLKPFESIYVCTDALFNFSNIFLSSITVPFILVTGDSDMPINSELLNHSVIIKLLESNFLIKWYAQNLDTRHHKLECIPIGLDYHTMRNANNGWGLSSQSPIAQERALLDILARSKDIKERFFSIYCNWHFQINRGNRFECFSQIDQSVCFFEKNYMPRLSTWKRQAEFIFVLSPEGAGIDCHRTWEALALGCIPIIKKSVHSEIYSNLPVLIVNEWTDVTKDLLIETFLNQIPKKNSFKMLFMDYWRCKINNIKRTALNDFTISEFQNYLTSESS